ncbi:Conserved hypothetical protein [Candidatus Phytoplasma australiense]|uniref:Uncharacterized protein n=1 Tax=Phytoplasma australiense TaxID=59748 RepID=B1V9P5_PHYAS|nr:Conserved hypothetical protein [Candidatus Phytoplasma australiense]
MVGKIDKIKIEIKKLESKQKMYQDMLSRAEKLKKALEERYEDAELQYKNEILKSLNNLYEITSAEE